MSEHDRCYVNAKARGQRTFTIVEQDDTAPETICDWIGRNIRTAPAWEIAENE